MLFNPDTAGGEHFWLDGDLALFGGWTLESGRELNYTAGWHPGEPNGGNCIMLVVKDPKLNTNWYDGGCGNLLRYICEI